MKAIETVGNTNQPITIFCSIDHIRFDQPSKQWVDWDFTPRALALSGFGNDQNKHPISPTVGRSLTTICSSPPHEIHVTFGPSVWNALKAGSSANQDVRLFEKVVSDGLLPGKNHIDDIKPLSDEVLHEVCNV
jgi:hypothetical protein